jgi:Ca-activated chloride channel family protein
VTGFDMLLHESEYVGGFSYEEVVQLSQGTKGDDKKGYRSDFINLVKSMGIMASR